MIIILNIFDMHITIYTKINAINCREMTSSIRGLVISIPLISKANYRIKYCIKCLAKFKNLADISQMLTMNFTRYIYIKLLNWLERSSKSKANIKKISLY